MKKKKKGVQEYSHPILFTSSVARLINYKKLLKEQ